MVVAPRLVRTAFTEVPAVRLWWRVVLALHGKPAGPDVSDGERDRVIAAGFRFYGLLYSVLGAVFLAAAAVCLLLPDLPQGSLWPPLGLGTGAYLVLAGRVACKGSALYRAQRDRSLALLLLFLLMVTAFLGLFLGAASAAADALGLVPGWLNAVVMAGAMAFGIGSYVIEGLYLLHAALAHRGWAGLRG